MGLFGKSLKQREAQMDREQREKRVESHERSKRIAKSAPVYEPHTPTWKEETGSNK